MGDQFPIVYVPSSGGTLRAYRNDNGFLASAEDTGYEGITYHNVSDSRFGARCNGIARYNVAATNSATSTITVSDTGHAFTSADVGKACGIIPYTDTGLTPRWGTITSITSPDVCVASLSGAPGTLSGATFVYGTDDSDAVEAAIDAAAALHGTVFIPTGITCVTRALTIPSGVTLMGAGNFPTGGKAKDFRHWGANLVLLKAFVSTDFVTLGDLGSSSPRGAVLCNINIDCLNFVRTAVSGLGSRTNHIRDCTILRGDGAETLSTGATGVVYGCCVLGQNNNNVVVAYGDSRVVNCTVTGAGNGYFGIKTSNGDDVVIANNHIWKDASATTMLGGSVWSSHNSGNLVGGGVLIIGNKFDNSYGPHVKISGSGNSTGRGVVVTGNIGMQTDAVANATYPFMEVSIGSGSILRGLVVTSNHGRGSWSDPSKGQYTYFIDGSGTAGNIYGSVVGGNVIDNCGAMFNSFTPDHDHGNITIAGTGTTLSKSTTT